MPQIQVAQPFTLTLNNGEQKLFNSPGTYEVTDEVANHSYTQHFLAKDGTPEAPRHPHEGQTASLYGPGVLVPEAPVTTETAEQQVEGATATLTVGTDAPEAQSKSDRSAKKVSS
jgi:hypothetical protein